MKNILLFFCLLIECNALFSQVPVAEQSAYLDSVLVDLSENENPLLRLSVLDEQLNLKNSLISELKFQIVQLDKDIYNNKLEFERLNSQLEYEKNIYASLIVKASRFRNLMYQNFDVFSFDNLYKMYRQFLYIKYLTDYRLKKIKRINALKAEIAVVVKKLDDIKTKKNSLAAKIGVEQSFISKYSISRNLVATEIKEENKKDFVSREIIKENLNLINEIDAKPLTENDNISVLFQIQKGYLSWPVKKAAIIRYFGDVKYPDQEKIVMKNYGLDFCVPKTSKVCCVYNGVVVKIIPLAQSKYSVIVRHGEYYTVYSDLDHISVSVGDNLEKNDVIGGFDSTNNYAVFNFQIWNGSKVQNPYDWLIKTEKNKTK